MSARRRGRLLALEGIDGAGKSTLARAVATALRRRGQKVLLRREPANPALGRLAQTAAARDAWAGAVYFTLDRFLARPSLERDLLRSDLVVTDRSLYSTLAYQGSRLSARAVRRLEELGPRATVIPDQVVLLDLSPEEAVRRLGRRGRVRGPLEHRRTLTRVAQRYRQMARARGWTVLDARRPTAELVAAILGELPRPPKPAARRSRLARGQRT